MGNVRRDAINKFIRSVGKEKNVVEEALQNIQAISASEGLLDGEFDDLVKLLTTNNFSSNIAVKLFHCLIPEKSVNSNALRDLLSWYFSKIGTCEISKATQKQFIHWLTGILHFDLGDVSVIDSYFHSFLFLLRLNHLESVVSKLLCLLLKPEDAKRWIVKKVLEIQRKSGPKAHTNSILSILKSFRPDVVPENVPMVRLNYDNSSYSDCFRSAHERKIRSSEYIPALTIEISWNQHRRYTGKSAHLPRLIPTPETIDFEPSSMYKPQKFHIIEAKNMSSLGANCLRIEIPSQTLSLLANLAGFHVLTFSDSLTKTRFSHKLRYTLWRVFVLELEPYPLAEKIGFLNSIVGLEEYMQEGIPVVTEFLFHYLLIWDGEEFRDQILKMTEWIVVKSVGDWQELFFPPIRQIFRSTGIHCKYLIIESLSSLLRNVIATMGRKIKFFDDSPVSDISYAVKAIEDLTSFVGELVVEGIIWNNEDGRRGMITSAINFYEICSVLDYCEEFPIVLAMPPALVYGCLFSNSRVCVARMCSLLLSFWRNTFERLLAMTGGAEYSVEIERTYIYILDYYRCLWSNTDYEQIKDSFIFRDKAFDELFWRFQNSCGVNIKRMFSVENNVAFVSNVNFFSKNCLENLESDYPAIVKLKLLCEDGVLDDCRRC